MRLLMECSIQSFLLLLLAEGLHGGTYSIIHPKLFHIDSDETVVVNLHGYGNVNVEVYASLTDYPSRNEIFSVRNENGNTVTPITFTMKATRDKFPGVETIVNKKVEMHVRIRFLAGGHNDINSKIRIYLTGESDYIFVQTDRPIYKPGESVTIRVAPLNLRMLPIRGNENTFEITVKTAEGVGIWKKTLTFPRNDFVTAEYKIPDDPPLGSYFAEAKLLSKTHVSTGSAEFKVDKYVLPTYSVKIQLDSSTVKPGDEIIGTFKAEYSYGEPVVGTYGIIATLHIHGREPLEFYEKPSSHTKRPGMLRENSNGRGNIRIATTEATAVSNMTWEELVDAGATVTVVVSAMGKAEGILESSSKEGILITNTPYMIDMSQASKYFVPSLSHNLNIIVRDVVTKEPVEGVGVVLSVVGTSQTRRGRSNDKGFTDIPVETLLNSNQLRLTIKTDDGLADEYQAHTTFTLEKHTSNHGYLRMSAQSHAEVDTEMFVRFKTHLHRPSEIYYMVISRGILLLSGKTAASQQEVSQSISITRKMSPSIRVVGYYMHGNNIVSDSVTIDVDDVCISKELTISVEPEEIQPGETVMINYEGEAQSMIGTSAVDRAAYFLHDKGRLDRHKMFEKMKSFDMGCSASGGRTPLNVFEEAGLACTTQGASTTPKSDLNCTEGVEARRKKRSIISLLEGRTVQQRFLMKKCNSNGRQENLAGEQCGDRSERIRRLDMLDETLCMECFLDGCNTGEAIRRSSAFKASKQRSSSNAVLDMRSHPVTIRRTDFSEGWLWFTRNLDHDGTASQRPSPPHSITTYDIDAISVSDSEGFCVAKPAELKVFKDFFIQLYLPYSVKVMEQVQIRAALFNYHKTKDRKITLMVKVDERLCTQGTPGEWSQVATLTVPREKSKSFIFTMIPLSVPPTGEARIEMKTEPFLSEDGSARDQIRRMLKVEPPGSEEEISGSFQLDPTLSSPNRNITFNLPDDDIVPDSKKCWIYGYMSFLGPIIEFEPIADTPKNLDKSLSLPHGCGEQNMKSVGPNVFSFNYLKYVGDPTPSTQSQVQKYIIDGYTRQQTHRNNGKWAIWHSAPPTIWINAYVDKVFLHAREVWPDMDIGPICQSLAWIVQQQQPDGSFSERAHSRHYWVNVAEGGEVGLTAYVLITLAETSAGCRDPALKRGLSTVEEGAKTYLRRTVNQDTIPYTAAIVAYALALTDPLHASTLTANRRLLEIQQHSADETFWQGPNRPRKHVPTWSRRQQAPIDIETTAYALLAQVVIARSQGSGVPQSTVEMINGIARWMVSQQNDRGGFQSSQTTVIAIQSMTEYAKWIHALDPPPRDPRLNLTLTAAGTTWENGFRFNLDKRHEFYRNELEVPSEVIEGTRHINVSVAGQGRGTMSYRCVYRSTKNSEVCDFNINVTTHTIGHFGDDAESEAAPGEGKDVIKLVLEISKISEGDSGMAIIDISLISGFIPIEASLDAITIGQKVDGVLDKYEVTDQNVILYVERIQHSQPLRLGFKLQQVVTVNGANPAKIIAYDYYNPEDTCTRFYNVPDGSPLIRTSCAPTSIDSSTEQMCKCAEGGCPTCRSREDQLEKTCGSRNPDSCHGCRVEYSECMKLRDSVCTRNYGLIIKITSIDKESMQQFIKMTATVNEVIRKTSDNELDRDQERTFIIRKDCFNKCHDVSVKTLSEDGDYFVTDRVFLIRGREPMRSMTSGGEKRFDYFLDKDAIVERTLDAAKCSKYETRGEECDLQDLPKCRNVRKKLNICRNQQAMRLGVREGCD